MTYPNILILDYMQRTRRGTPETRLKAEQLVGIGYQRLLTFQAPEGGFGWFPGEQADPAMTAYGLAQLAEMARVYPVDEAVLARTSEALVRTQRPDGSWTLGGAGEPAEPEDELILTAYAGIALALAGEQGGAARRAADHLRERVGADADPYLLALSANLAALLRPRDARTRQLLDLLDAAGRREGNAAVWSSEARTVTRATGEAAKEETTALAALAYFRAGYRQESGARALNYLVRRRGAHGAWSTTQATVRALQALIAGQGDGARPTEGRVLAQVNGRPAGELAVTRENADIAQFLDLTPALGPGPNRVSLSAEGGLQPLYQLVSRCYVPWTGEADRTGASTLGVTVSYDRTELRQNQVLTAEVRVRSRAPRALSMVIVDVGLAPGFMPNPESLNALVREELVDSFEVTPRQLTLYLPGLAPGAETIFRVRLGARFPVRATAPPVRAYEYYNPENRASTRPARFQVTRM